MGRATPLDDAPLRWHPVRCQRRAGELSEPERTLEGLLRGSSRLAAIPPGSAVAIAVGSRGIHGIDRLVRLLVESLRRDGARPFLVPAMGSHGGGTPKSQQALLGSLGLGEPALGAPVVSEASVTRIGDTASGIPVWCDAAAWDADFIIPLNRVKPHTAFQGRVESGPSKLLAVGLGKAHSARAAHVAGLGRAVPELAQHLLDTGKIPFGIAVVENAHGRSAKLALLEPETWLAKEEQLLALARELSPRLPWDELDLLVIDRIGKDISGTGMDLHVVGMGRRFPAWASIPQVRRIVALDLTAGSHGNANGVGYADVVTRSLAAKIDWEATYANCRTTGFLEAAKLPLVAANEIEAVRAALDALRPLPRGRIRGVRIRDTSSLSQFRVTAALLEELPPGVRPDLQREVAVGKRPGQP